MTTTFTPHRRAAGLHLVTDPPAPVIVDLASAGRTRLSESVSSATGYRGIGGCDHYVVSAVLDGCEVGSHTIICDPHAPADRIHLLRPRARRVNLSTRLATVVSRLFYLDAAMAGDVTGVDADVYRLRRWPAEMRGDGVDVTGLPLAGDILRH